MTSRSYFTFLSGQVTNFSYLVEICENAAGLTKEKMRKKQLLLESMKLGKQRNFRYFTLVIDHKIQWQAKGCLS